MKASTLLANLSILGVVGVGLAYPASSQGQDQRKDATAATTAANDRLLDELPFSDRSDFESAKRGLIAPLPTEMIEGQCGNPIWNPEQNSFINEDAAAPDTVNPSLWRQSQLIKIGVSSRSPTASTRSAT
jgi:alkyl sulfatase BDS1-like metallo-beta-lactamase superfamily hydrolase